MSDVIAIAAAKAEEAAKDMRLGGVVRIIGELDALSPEKADELLEAKSLGGDSVLVVGDWRVGDARNVDAYDLVLKFLEDDFTRMRSYKSPDGWYAAAATGKLR
jgi:hypothetical protein